VENKKGGCYSWGVAAQQLIRYRREEEGKLHRYCMGMEEGGGDRVPPRVVVPRGARGEGGNSQLGRGGGRRGSWQGGEVQKVIKKRDFFRRITDGTEGEEVGHYLINWDHHNLGGRTP